MKTKISVSWSNLGKAVIFLSLMFVFCSTWVTSQASNQQLTIPSDYTIEIARAGVELYKDTSTGTKFVQVVKLDMGATVRLLHGTIANPGTGDGPYGGNNPSFWRQTIQEAWSEFSVSDNNAFCMTNGQFFSSNPDPTTLAFSLKKDGAIVSDGYAVAGSNEEYIDQKLMLEIWGNRADIVPLTRDNLYNSDAPNIIAGLTEEANKGPLNLVGRTFVGIDDANNDGTYEVVLVFNSSSATQASAASVLRNFGADKVIMLDGGGSTQLICNGQLYVPSSDNPDRTIPQTLAVSYARNTSGTVDVALIIDSSGSMTSNDPRNKRLEAARAYLTASLKGDYVGVVDFDSGVRLASPLRILPENKTILINAINTINSSGGTNIGIGVQEGCNALINSSSSNTIKAAILLTDGVGSFAGQDSCFKVRGWPIYTFGFGSANDALLQQIATNTGGEFARLPTSDFVCEFQRVRSKIAGVEPGPCTVIHIGPFEITIFSITVPSGQEQVSFAISWPGSDVEMALTSPSGRVIDRNTNAPDVIHDLGSTFEIYTILNPEPGDWEVELYGADVPADGEDVVFSFTNIPSVNQPPSIINPGQQSVEYSDPFSLNVTATDPDNPVDALGFSANGLPSDLSFADNGDGTATISGVVLAAPGTYDVEVTVTDPDGLSDTKTIPIVVSEEDARTTYTGPMLVSTGCADCSMATVPLRATIRDITAVAGDIAYDPDPGNITNATVTFVNRSNGNAPLCSANITLLDPGDAKVGTATCDWLADIGNNVGLDYSVGIVVDGYYTRDSTEDDTIVVVSKPTSYFITGGGYLTNQNSAGLYAGDPWMKTNFGLNVKFDKKLKNLMGRVMIIVRQGEAVYQIKSNALSSLAVVPYDPANPNSGAAELISKANITDVTDPLYPIEILGNATLLVRMEDNGEPGSADVIGVTLWSSGGTLLYSSNWDGVQTIQQVLDGGNLQVH